jgi:hypothetical protein
MIGKTMSNAQQIEQIELTIEQGRAKIAKGNALNRLSENPDFKEIVREGYFKDEAVRLVQAKASPGMSNDAGQAAIVKSIDAIGGLLQYFVTIQTEANLALEAMGDHEEAITELEAEEGDI